MLKNKSVFIFLCCFLFIYGKAYANEINILCDGKNDVSGKLSNLGDVNINFTEGTCIFSQPLVINSNVSLNGAGNNKTILKAPGNLPHDISFISLGNNESTKPVRDVSIHNLTLYGQNEEFGFSEHNHLLSLKGAENATISNNRFLAFQGDAIYIGRAKVKNKNIQIKNNYFDGLNYKNRNAISIITGGDIDIESNYFYRTTMRNMPGAIDLEPNNGSQHFIQRVNIKNNKFLSIGGKAAIVVSIRHIYNTKINNITIVDNKIYNTKRGVYVYAKNQNSSSMPHDFNISNNRIIGANIRPLLVCNIQKVKVASKDVDFNSYCPLTQRALSLMN
ncbi:hypothetical protein [Superficieibacter sp. 1612_C1]|uniref:hypothetical protein n=1 Tax=Superficieibacter sp. 1612_C1 TaxID=2780382 RepID=UPI0018848D0F|nr:hypothetical protein [Superficieibacter sp. 1612_C1]